MTFFILSYWLITLLTSFTVVPLPAAILRLWEDLMIDGSFLSALVID